MDVDGVGSTLVEGVAGGVGSVSVVSGVDFNAGGSADGDSEVVSTEGLVVSALVSRLDGEVEGGESRKSSIGSRLAVDCDGGALDGLSLESDVDDVVSGNIWVVGDSVGSVSVVDNLRRGLRSVRVADGHSEVVSSVVAWVSVLVDGVDGENSGFVVPQLFQSRSLGV